MARTKSTYGANGVIIFDNLWNILKDKGYSKKWLVEQKVSPTLVNKLRKNENVSCELIVKICNLLDCQPCDFMEYARKDGSKPKAITSRQSETPSEPPNQAHTATKTEQADILSYGSEKELKEDRIKCKSVMVDVDGQEVELWLDQYNGVFDRHDAEQLEAFRRWKCQQMPKVDDAPKQEPEKEEPEQAMQRIDETLLDVLPENVREKVKGENDV